MIRFNVTEQELAAEQRRVVELVETGARWSKNILVELLGNYAGRLTEEQRAGLRQAIEGIDRFQLAAKVKP